ncbi:hypothetical protein [Bacillus sp. V2I10]|nr:hypothetical protein [Bacillus sp. V2I10]MDQ0859211.1 hypothetical protein [Bacillus sp. V2I10]
MDTYAVIFTSQRTDKAVPVMKKWLQPWKKPLKNSLAFFTWRV